jgi:hypothetical protein
VLYLSIPTTGDAGLSAVVPVEIFNDPVPLTDTVPELDVSDVSPNVIGIVIPLFIQDV